NTRFKCDWSSDVCSSDLGTSKVSSSFLHDNSSNGIRAEAGAVTVTTSEISSNDYGIYAVLGTVSISETWLAVNTQYAVYNLSAPQIDATNNYWGSTWGPRPTGSGDLISSGVSYDPWHHV